MICIPLANRLPNTFQRALSFLPVNIDPVVRAEAQGSLDWRIEMWKALLPQVPPHLLLGKGYAISQEDYQLMGTDTAFHSIDPAEQGLALSGDYHSGPLSVILPFGIWGAIAFLWFLIAGVWALHHNRLYGDPALQTVNTFLFTAFLAKIISFIFIFGGLSGDIAGFAGLPRIEHQPERRHLPSGPAARRDNRRASGAPPGAAAIATGVSKIKFPAKASGARPP